MRRLLALLPLFLIPAQVLAHAGQYHNYAGFPLLAFALILIGALALYEARGKTAYGKAALIMVLAALFVIEIFFPSTDFFAPQDRHATEEAVAGCFGEHAGEPYNETLIHCQEEICGDDHHCMEEVENFALQADG